MGDTHATMAAQKLLACSREDTEEFQQILAEEDARYERGEIDDCSGFEAEHIEGEGALFYSQDTPHPECLPEAFIRKVAEVLTRLREPYLEFGVSYTHDGPCADGEGGYFFRVTDKGKVVFAEMVWPVYADADPEDIDRAQESLERLLEFWNVRQGAAIAALDRYLQYRVHRFFECAYCGANLSEKAVETNVGRFCATQCAELEELCG